MYGIKAKRIHRIMFGLNLCEDGALEPEPSFSAMNFFRWVIRKKYVKEKYYLVLSFKKPYSENNH